MPVREMYEDHTLWSLMNAIKGFRESPIYRDGWYQARMIAYYILQVNLSEQDRMKGFTDLITFPWEPGYQEWLERNKPPERRKIQSKEDLEAFVKGH